MPDSKEKEAAQKWKQAILSLMDAAEMANAANFEGAAEKCYESAKSAMLALVPFGTLTFSNEGGSVFLGLIESLRAIGERVHERPISGTQVKEAVEAARDVLRAIHEINPERYPYEIEA